MASPTVAGQQLLTGGSGAGTTAAFDLTSLSVAAGDLILVFLYKENTAAMTPPGGYTQKAQTTATVSVIEHTLFYHQASGSESGTVTFSWTGSTWRDGYAIKISGAVTSGDPFDGTPATGTSGSSSVSTAPAVSLAATSANTLLVYSQTNFAGTINFTPPTGYTENADNDTIETAWKDNTAGGATGTVQGTASATSTMTAILASIASPSAPSTPPTLRVIRSNIRY